MYDWLKDDKYKQAKEDVQESLMDFCESQMYQLMKGIPIISENKVVGWETPPNSTILIFYAKTKGKKRGYVEKQEIEHSKFDGVDDYILEE